MALSKEEKARMEKTAQELKRRENVRKEIDRKFDRWAGVPKRSRTR